MPQLVAAPAALILRTAPFVTLLLAAWIVGRFAERSAPRFRLGRPAIAGLTPALVVAAIVAGRLVAIAPHWRVVVAHPLDLLRITGADQLSFFGGAAGAVGGLVFFGWRAGLSVPRVADLYGAVVPLGFAVYGAGCLLRKDCYGREAPTPFGIVFPGLQTPRYPVELYAAVAALFAYTGLRWAGRRCPAPGMVALAAVATLGAIRTLLNPLRLDAEAGLLDRDRIASLAVTALTLVLLQVIALGSAARSRRGAFRVTGPADGRADASPNGGVG